MPATFKPTVEQTTQLVELVLRAHLPATKSSQVRVKYSPHCPYTFAARRSDAGVLVETRVSFTNPRCHHFMRRAAQAALEIIEGRTHAVKIRENMYA